MEDLKNRTFVSRLIISVLTEQRNVREAIKLFPETKDRNIECAYHALVHYEADEDLRKYDIEYRDAQNEYLEYIKKMEEMNLDIASEYLVMASELIEYKSKECESDFMDQNAFNTVFEDNIKFLSPTFNLLTTIKAKYNNSDIANFYNISVNELDAIYKSPVILHMAGGVKPWNNILCDNFATNLPYLCKLPKSKLRNNAVYNLFKQNPKRFIKYYILKVLNIGGIIGK